MKSKTSRYDHYANRQAIIASLSGVDEEFDSCVACIDWKRCWNVRKRLCPCHLSDEHYKPVKIRKTTMRKLLKRRRAEK